MTPLSATRLRRSAVALFLACLPLCLAQPEAVPAPPTDREKITQDLFASTDVETLAANIEKAIKGGLPQQAVLEARFLFLVDQQDYAAVARLAPILEMQRKLFRIQDSVIFSVPEEFFAIIEYCHALGALEKGDEPGFKKHITEAFWLSPRQATAFAPHIERLRLESAMAKLSVDLQLTFAAQADGNKIALASLAAKSGYLLLHFWSPWSNECEASLPDFTATAKELARHGIGVASVLVEPSADALKAAREFRAAIKEEQPGEWIVDNSAAPLSRLLRVQDLPTVVLLNAEGKILFNGYPADDGLWTALRTAVPAIIRPRLEAGHEAAHGALPE